MEHLQVRLEDAQLRRETATTIFPGQLGGKMEESPEGEESARKTSSVGHAGVDNRSSKR